MYADNSGWWFALALVNAGLAEQKGRSRLAWFLISLLLGPFATAWIVIAPRAEGVSSIAPEGWPAVALLMVAVVLVGMAVVAALAAAANGEIGLWIACAVAAAGAVLFGFAAWRKRPAASRTAD